MGGEHYWISPHLNHPLSFHTLKLPCNMNGWRQVKIWWSSNHHAYSCAYLGHAGFISGKNCFDNRFVISVTQIIDSEIPDACLHILSDSQASCSKYLIYIIQRASLWTSLEYELVDANRVCPGIHNVRVGPATRSVVATCSTKWNCCFDRRFVISVIHKL